MEIDAFHFDDPMEEPLEEPMVDENPAEPEPILEETDALFNFAKEPTQEQLEYLKELQEMGMI